MDSVLHLGNVGLALAIVGVIFLANSMGIRNPRRFIQEFFGIERQRPLRTVLDQLKAKAQIFTGFLFLMAGFSLQIVSSAFPPAVEVLETTEAERWQGVVLLAMGVVLLSALLRVAQLAWSLMTFRRLLQEFFSERPDWNFEKHPAVTREIGDILGIDTDEDDSISDYAERVRSVLGIRAPARRPTIGVRDDAFAPVRKVGSDRRL